MNIFLLALTPQEAAKLHCDAHVGKTLIECLQMLYTALRARGWEAEGDDTVAIQDGLRVMQYKDAHPRHPCTLWAGSCRMHMRWLLVLAKELALEWERRGLGKKPETARHRCAYHVDYLIDQLDGNLDNWPAGMPEICSAEQWLDHLRDLDGGGDKIVDSVRPRLVREGLPSAVAFAVACVDEHVVDEFLETFSGAIDKYLGFYATKQHKFDMRWSGSDEPPAPLKKPFAYYKRAGRLHKRKLAPSGEGYQSDENQPPADPPVPAAAAPAEPAPARKIRRRDLMAVRA